MATAIAAEFGMDPIAVLKSNEFEWMLRCISLEMIVKQREAARPENQGRIDGIE